MLGGSLRMFSIAGTDVRLHPTFFLLLIWIAAVYWLQGGPVAAVAGVIFVALLFGCVVLHEFGHIFAARRYGIRTPDVTLFPFGGVAALERLPEKPAQEIFVALAGPAVNAVIAVVLIALFNPRFDVDSLATRQLTVAGMIGQVAVANVILAVFNLIPAFPMDGGRVLRALLAVPFGYTRATRVAATVGQIFAVGLGFLGLFGNPLLVLIAIFIFIAAASEAGFVEARDVTRGHLVGDAMITRFESLVPQSTVDDAANLLLRTTQQEFPVIDDAARLQGVVTRAMIVNALKEQGGAAPVSGIMMRDVRTVPEGMPLETAFRELSMKRESCIGVVGPSGSLLGYLTLENLSELIMIGNSRSARKRAHA